MTERKKVGHLFSKQSSALVIVSAAAIVIAVLLVYLASGGSDQKRASMAAANNSINEDSSVIRSTIPSALLSNFDTDFNKASLSDFSSVVQGIPGSNPKDSIPALNQPKFIQAAQSEIPAAAIGLFIDLNNEAKFYPYPILVWHEIVNDEVGGQPVLVTFCPLCGTGIAYDPVLNGQHLEFGVSGFLRESNMIMYDRSTQSLWQQSTGQSFAGQFNSQQLQRIDVDLKTFDEAKSVSDNLKVLSTDTGFNRNYQNDPYGDYDNDDLRFIFQPSEVDTSYPAKELFYVVNINDKSVALRYSKLDGSKRFELDGGATILTAAKNDQGLIDVTTDESEVLPGYFEMWFSWSIWHQEDGLVWDPSN